MTNAISVMWFRQDLRINDNPALHAACESGDVIPVYIIDTDTPEQFQKGGASTWWLHHSLTSLNQSLDGNLQIFVGSAKKIILELMDAFGASRIFWNRCYTPWEMERDRGLKTALKERGFIAKSFNGSLLWEPMDVLKKDGTPYKVFTPYYRKGCLGAQSPRVPMGVPSNIKFAEIEHKGTEIDALKLLPTIPWDTQIAKQWQPGEISASDKLEEFISSAIMQYRARRDLPSVAGTSQLSPHLHFGEISPHQIWYAVLSAFGDTSQEGIDTYLSEIGWREFSYYLLYHFPTLATENFNTKFDHFKWLSDNEALNAWKHGNTGIPIVDAGMRELWQTGYMHNRVRMIVGSFLVKNLLIDWREGERWFWDCLLDADLASNSASWQWVAGSGADAAPYFRVFNPVLQGEKFDTKGNYVRRYCPELKDLPDKYIHKPWEAPSIIAKGVGVELGKTYPMPIVDLKASRLRALDAFAQIKGK